MRIAMITASPRNVAAGSGTFVASVGVADGLRALGHEVDLITPGTAPGPLGFTVHRLWFNRRLHPQRVRSADVVVGWDMDGYRLAGKTHGTFATYIHGQLADEARFERGWVALAMRLQARAERVSVQRADRVVTVSEYSRRRIATVYDRSVDDIHVVPPAFDAQGWAEALEAVPPATGDGPPRILSVCHLYPRKDVATLVRAAVRVRAVEPAVRIEIVGDGPERTRLTRLVRRLGLQGTVRLHGQVPFGSLVAHYAACDVFCLPSLQEGFGLVFLEAMAAGKPVVGCRGSAVEELIRPDETGLLAPPRDPDGLADVLLALLRDPQRRRRLGMAGPSIARRYDQIPVARRLLDAVAPITHRGER
jgi:glycosyltransferase involved in cell wall biosynthesis